MTTRPGRGRPKASDGADRRAALVDAARRLFAERGFAGTSLRAVAREVGVDPALVSHYFGDKQGLLVATMALPVDPAARIREVLAGGPAGLGERLVRTFTETWDPHEDVIAALLRTAMTGDTERAPALQLARDVLVVGVREQLDGADADGRAALVAAQVVGLAVTRYVARLPHVRDLAPAELARVYGPAVQTLVDGR
ncbi:TetR/AcrR family transcriptional regulator [Aeromicrobium massiliense]|uniref:TetR/AcrR family transcriptional regulator n=1 Tax=Aeromicrobium massiliense TaxID=1464554 RepID=UPI000675F6D2|nr:TetR family transcriptional regulator [Aeromicrobium massiliense]